MPKGASVQVMDTQYNVHMEIAGVGNLHGEISMREASPNENLIVVQQ